MPSGYKLQVDLEEFRKLYAEFGTLKKVAEATGYHYTALSKFAKQNGININRHFCKYYYNPTLFTKDDEKSFYWAGFLAADGCVTKANCSYLLVVCLAIKDLAHLEKFKTFTGTDAPIQLCAGKDGHPGCQFKLCSKEIFDNLGRFNIVPRKSLIYSMPEWLKDHPLVHHFIRGYIDGDGCFGTLRGKIKRQKYLSIVGTFACLSAIEKIIKKNCGLDYDKKITQTNNVFKIGYCGNGIIPKITNFLYTDATVYLKRKFEVALG